MREFEVGLFEVVSTEPMRGVSLQSIGTGKNHFVYDISASLSVKPEDVIWTRIAPVTGLYHAIGSIFFVLPIKILSGMRQTINSWGKNSFDAREIAKWFSGNPKKFNIENNTEKELSLEEVEHRFTEALKLCGMDNFFSIKTFKRWLRNEKKYGPSFATKTLFFLTPETITEENITTLMNTSMEFANRLPRKKLGEKSPLETAVLNTDDPEQKLKMDIYGRDTYTELQGEAHELLLKGESRKTYAIYENIIKKLLAERTPFF